MRRDSFICEGLKNVLVRLTNQTYKVGRPHRPKSFYYKITKRLNS
jgi:hypothetical protein